MILQLQHFLPYVLAASSEVVSNSFMQVYQEKYQLTPAQWRVLSHLYAVQPLTSTQLCERASLDKSTASRAITQLVTRGLILSEQDEKDKRAKSLSLSEQGMKFYQQLAPEALAWQNQLQAVLTEQEAQQLQHSLLKIQTRARELKQKGS